MVSLLDFSKKTTASGSFANYIGIPGFGIPWIWWYNMKQQSLTTKQVFSYATSTQGPTSTPDR